MLPVLSKLNQDFKKNNNKNRFIQNMCGNLHILKERIRKKQKILMLLNTK